MSVTKFVLSITFIVADYMNFILTMNTRTVKAQLYVVSEVPSYVGVPLTVSLFFFIITHMSN